MTPQEIDAARTPAGGWTREQLATWGVPWPPPKGWKDRLVSTPCQECGYPHTQPAGACFLCPECGTSSGCS